MNQFFFHDYFILMRYNNKFIEIFYVRIYNVLIRYMN